MWEQTTITHEGETYATITPIEDGVGMPFYPNDGAERWLRFAVEDTQSGAVYYASNEIDALLLGNKLALAAIHINEETTRERHPDAYTSADGNARLLAEVFDELRTGEPVTYMATLSFETRDAIASIKCHSHLTWEEANAQVTYWTRLYNLN
jgi:hypothetical protein